MHLGELGTQHHASLVALMAPDQLTSSTLSSAKWRWLCVKLTMQSSEQAGILAKAINLRHTLARHLEKLGGGPQPAVLGVC